MSNTIIRCENLFKSYTLGRVELRVLRGVSLSFERGKFVTIIGSSGSGKSTLLHVLSGLDVPQQGQVWFEGAPLFEPESARRIPVGRDSRGDEFYVQRWLGEGAEGRSAAHAPKGPAAQAVGIAEVSTGPRTSLESRRNELLNRAFGFVFQFYHLLPEFDVLENVLLPAMVGRSMADWLEGRARTEARARSLLAQVGLADRLRHRPNELSGGERQRVAIARALMNGPRVLFADEPTGNLDARTGQGIFELLKSLNAQGQTIIMVSHDRDLAARTDAVVHLVDGRVE